MRVYTGHCALFEGVFWTPTCTRDAIPDHCQAGPRWHLQANLHHGCAAALLVQC